MEQRLDERNMLLAKYKIIDFIVKMTGNIPAFSYWFALVVIACLVKLATFPLTLKTYKSQREMQAMQPVLKKIQEQYKDDRVKMNEQVMAAYKEHGVSPFATCIPMIVQLPFLYFVYNMIQQYEFHFANGYFLWISPGLGGHTNGLLAGNLAQFDMALLVLYCISNFITMRLTPPSDPAAAETQKQMSIMMSLVMFWMFMSYKWSSAFTFYWLIQNFISAFQQYKYIYKPNKMNLSDAVAMSDGPSHPATASALRPNAKSTPPAAPRAATSGTPSRPSKPSTSGLATPRPVSSGTSGGGRPRAKGKGKKK